MFPVTPNNPKSFQRPIPALMLRIRNLLIEPRSEWPLIASEPGGMRPLLRYIAMLALIPAICGLYRLDLYWDFGIGRALPRHAADRRDQGTDQLSVFVRDRVSDRACDRRDRAAIRRTAQFHQRAEARGLFLYADMAARNHPARAGPACSDAIRALCLAAAMDRSAAADGPAAQQGDLLRHCHRGDRVCHRICAGDHPGGASWSCCSA